ncbi:ABC transporter ATP-binding protein [Natronococcus occultus]|uniref:ABC-type polar amino acid transport system, ATPase component n=1 Tax=Natronococcus occultus SP4 TaxID=694430 RepID=L0JYL2_9EURY|nr:ATP-binding cassette domain-containing protein [Natronococcus occultus]AGB37826.1 ABC-type polar amino acid transport system, ATPase component [Natronococcus occultus SP4]
MEAKLETESLTRTVSGETIVEDVSLRVGGSTVLAVVGSSGAGKSSFLRLLNRLDEPTDGTVFLDGVDYREIDPQTLRRRIGLVPQESALRPGTVRENVAASDRIRGEPVDDERVAALLDRVQLPNAAERDVEDLSGGQQQRVAVARTLYVDPEVLLLDEPTSHLDSETEARVEELLGDLIRTEGLTCVLVTHDTAQAERLADRVAEFEDGRVVAEGRPEEVLA